MVQLLRWAGEDLFIRMVKGGELMVMDLIITTAVIIVGVFMVAAGGVAQMW